MKKAKISELKNDLSRYLAYVRRGGVVRVFDRDRPIAEIVPLRASAATESAAEELLADLEREGVVTRGRGTLPADFLTRSLPRPGASVVDAVVEEREEGW